MFGRSIKETLKIESHRGGGMTPIIVELCVEYIRKHGMSISFTNEKSEKIPKKLQSCHVLHISY